MKRRSFFKAIAAAPVAAKAVAGGPDPFVLGRRLVDAAREKHGDIRFRWAYGAYAVTHIIREAHAFFIARAARPEAPYPWPPDMEFCGYPGSKERWVSDDCASLWHLEVTYPSPRPDDIVAQTWTRTTRFICGSINLKTGEVTYGATND